MKQFSPAVHHDKDKRCRISFRINGTYHVMRDMCFKSRQEALSHVKSYHRGASQISIVFYVPQIETVQDVSQNDTADTVSQNETSQNENSKISE